MQEKMEDPEFTNDMQSLLRPGITFNASDVYPLIYEQISSIFPDSTIIPVEVKGIVKKGEALNCVSWNYFNN